MSNKGKGKKRKTSIDKFLDKCIKENKESNKLEAKDEAAQNKTSQDKVCNSNSNDQQYKNINDLIKIAEEMWQSVKNTVKDNREFIEYPDKKKMEHFRNTPNYCEFMKEYPIVSRYMICMGQYNTKAFRKMLEKIRMTIHPPPEKREKGYIEDQWIRRNADYIRYLWEAYKKGHYDNTEAKLIWNDAYKNLRGEMDDFRDKYKEIEKSIKEEKEQFKAENTKDLLNRLKTKEQTLPKKDSQELYEALKNKLIHRRFKNTMKQLLEKIPFIEPVFESYGKGPEDKDYNPDNKPTIKMIETVDADRINEVPPNMIIDKKMYDSLPGGSTLLPRISETNEDDDNDHDHDNDHDNDDNDDND